MGSISVPVLVIPILAVVAPLLAALVGRVAAIPLVVFEIVLGIIVGPSGFGWVPHSSFVDGLADLGLAMLFFMAGSEIDFGAIKGRPIRRASLGWLISLALATVIGIVGPGSLDAGIFIGIALSSTALGTLIPILRDERELGTPFGRAVVAVGAAGEFGPLVAMSLFLGGRNPGLSTVVLVAFVVLTVVAIWLAGRTDHRSIDSLVQTTLHTSGQFAVRLVIMVITVLATVAMLFELDMPLGAFAAGVLWQVLVRHTDHAQREQIESKVEAVGFGFLVPIFFINTGITFDLRALLADTTSLVLVPAFLLVMLVVRGVPGLLSAPPGATMRDRRALVLFTATGLPIIVAVTKIGQTVGVISPSLAAALVGAGMLSVLLFPLIALSQRRMPRIRTVIDDG